MMKERMMKRNFPLTEVKGQKNKRNIENTSSTNEEEIESSLFTTSASLHSKKLKKRAVQGSARKIFIQHKECNSCDGYKKEIIALKQEVEKLKEDLNKAKKERNEERDLNRVVTDLKRVVEDLSGLKAVNIRKIEDKPTVKVEPQDVGKISVFDPQLLFDGSELDTCRLVPDKPIYVLESAYHRLSKYTKNQTTIVRSGLTAIFKTDAIVNCSVRGGLAKGPLGKPTIRREALNYDAVTALMEFSNIVAENMHWPKVSQKDLVSAMGTKISELRAQIKKRP